MTYDPQCYDLAANFLQDHMRLFNERNNVELAQEIQRCIEDFIAHKWDNYEPPVGTPQ
jgi:hypothetical protein